MTRRRRLVGPAMLLAAGLILTVASSWTIAVFSGLGPPRTRLLRFDFGDVDLQWVNRSRPTNWPELPAVTGPVINGMPGVAVMRRSGLTARLYLPNSTAESRAVVLDAGWPRRALRGIRWIRRLPDGRLERIHQRCVDLPYQHLPFRTDDLGRRIDGRMLPLQPLWSGIAVNTLTWAAITWLVVRGPWHGRRIIRRRRGRCPACGYILGDAPRCPECGIVRSSPQSAAPTAE